MTGWIKYFLQGVAETAEGSSQTLSRIISLKQETETIINARFGRKSPSAIALLQFLFVKPVVNVSQVKAATNLSYNAANSLVSDFVTEGILEEVTGSRRNRVFVFKTYLSHFSS